MAASLLPLPGRVAKNGSSGGCQAVAAFEEEGGGGGGRHYQDWPDTGSVAWSPIEMGSCQAMAVTVGVIVGRVVAKQ